MVSMVVQDPAQFGGGSLYARWDSMTAEWWLCMTETYNAFNNVVACNYECDA